MRRHAGWIAAALGKFPAILSMGCNPKRFEAFANA
jgi:hypothetical protein